MRQILAALVLSALVAGCDTTAPDVRTVPIAIFADYKLNGAPDSLAQAHVEVRGRDGQEKSQSQTPMQRLLRAASGDSVEIVIRVSPRPFHSGISFVSERISVAGQAVAQRDTAQAALFEWISVAAWVVVRDDYALVYNEMCAHRRAPCDAAPDTIRY